MTQRSAKPRTPVQFRSVPPWILSDITACESEIAFDTKYECGGTFVFFINKRSAPQPET